MPVIDIAELRGPRIGVLGGTFDPIHNGHLSLARHVQEQFRLDKLLFIPAARPPHKDHAATIPFSDRLAMLELAIKGNDRFAVSDLELYREGPSYSIDTLADLTRLLPAEIQLFFIIGMDAFVVLNTWKKFRELTDHANLLVIDRPDYPLSMIEEAVGQLGDYGFVKGQNCWTTPGHEGKIYPVRIPPVDISSTEIRERIKQGKVFAELVPVPVFEYIRRKELYL